MKKVLIIIGVVINLVGVNTLHAQINLNNISVNFGNIIQDVSACPEIQLGGDFFTPSICWTAYWGYGTDGINAVSDEWIDGVTYSSSGHIVGMRLALFPGKPSDKRSHQIGIFVGVSHYFISVKYIGGAGIDGKPGHDYIEDASTFDTGLIAEVPVLGPIGIRGEFQLGFLRDAGYGGRVGDVLISCKLGIFYTF